MRNSAILAGIAFVLFVPLALLLGVLAGVIAGRPRDYVISLTSLAVNALPEFVIATFLIVIFFNSSSCSRRWSASARASRRSPTPTASSCPC